MSDTTARAVRDRLLYYTNDLFYCYHTHYIYTHTRYDTRSCFPLLFFFLYFMFLYAHNITRELSTRSARAFHSYAYL